MRKKQLLAVALSVCLAVTPPMSVNAQTGLTVEKDSAAAETVSESESGSETVEETVSEGESSTTAEVASESESESTTEAETASGSGSESTTEAETASESESTTEAETASESGSENTTEAETASESENTTEAESTSESDINSIAKVYADSDSDSAVSAENSITEDFEAVTDFWGMTGVLVDESKLSIAEDGSNHYLAVNGQKYATRTATKTFENVPDMETAEVSFKWYTTSLTSDSRTGRPGITLKSGDVDVVSVYVGEMRDAGADTAVYYSVQGGDITDTGKKVKAGAVQDVKISVDFTTMKAVITINGEEYATVDVNMAATKVDALMLNMAGGKGSDKTYTVNMGIDDYAMSWTEAQPSEGTISEDFEAVTDFWGMTGTLVDENKLSIAEEGSNHYLAANGEKYATRTATKTFDNLPDMGTAEVSFKWYTTSLTSDSRTGRPGITLKSGDVDVVSVYVGEMRDAGADTAVYYSVQGGDITDTGKKVKAGAVQDVKISVDFTTMKAVITINGEEYATVDVNMAATKVDALMLNMAGGKGSGKTYTVNMGIDDFSLYYKAAGAIEKPKFIASLAELEAVTVTKEEYEGSYAHPQTVKAVLSDETEVELEIDQDTWISSPAIDVNEMGTITWTASVKLPDKVTNPLNLQVSYVMDYKSDFLDTDINSLGTLNTYNVTKQAWEDGTYTHPGQVSAKLVNDKIITVSIDKNSWKCEPEFDVNTKGSYVWTADIVAPEGYRNHRGLTVSYTMNYYGNWESEHDYEDDFTFGISGWNVWGKDVDKTSGTGGFTFSLKEEDGNAYLYGTVSKSGAGRGSRLDLPGGIVKGAAMEFDWNPAVVASGHADLLFMAPVAKQNYFTIYADSTGAIKYYTTEDANNDDAQNNSFEGIIAEADAVATGVGGINQWFTVKVDFDYIAHTAAITVTSKDDPSKTYSADNIAIDERANGLSLMVVRKPAACSQADVAFDNIIIDYSKFDENDIVDVDQPSYVNVAAVKYDEYTFPSEVTVTLGDGSTDKVKVGEWAAEPAFDKDTEAVYTWTAPLIPGQYTNYFDLKASFSMNYTMLPYVTSVNNPATLELEYGEAWDVSELPETATIILSDGTVRTDAPVGEWTAIRAFNSEAEGIYIYGAKLAENEGEYAIDYDAITVNEYHGDLAKDELKDSFIYDVYYRVSYYKSNNNYNGYERAMEYLDRGVTAVPADNGILVSWRCLVDEYGTDVQFNVLRNGKQINSEPVTSKTNYLDTEGEPGNLYAVETIKNGKKTTSEYVKALSESYLSIPLQKPDPQPDKDGNLATYSINDAGVADVDGDGQYEIVVKWYPSDAFDSGKQDGPSAPTIFDCYEMDGTPLWRINMGLEIPSGAHWNQFMLYDMDEDGKAEFFIKTSDGTISYRPNADGLFDMNDESTIISYIGDKSVIPGKNVNSTGHVNTDSNEYITVFNGETGKEIDTIDYINTVKGVGFDAYGDNWGNRASRFNIAVAYLPKDKDDTNCTETIPAVLLNRGYYNKTTVAAYTLRDGRLQLEWNFNTENGTEWAGKGNHNVATGDMDNDGFDELVIGAMAIDHDGTVLWVKSGKDGQDYQGHADSIHLAAMNPENPTQLYVFTPSEEKESTLNATLSNAANGSRINGTWNALADIGRGVAANITPAEGFEYWANNPNSEGNITGAIFNIKGSVIAATKPDNISTNWVIYWDGDLLSELADGYNASSSGTAQSIYKYDWENNVLDRIETFEGTHTNNSTKNNPSLTADLFGDWREEVMVGNSDNTELRIYMTSYETDYMIYSLMQDPVYRNAVANQNTAYNQPPHLGFYLGEDNKDQVLAMELPTAKIRYTTDGTQTAEGDYVAKAEVVADEAAVNDALNEALENEELKTALNCNDASDLKAYMLKKLLKAAEDKKLGTVSSDNTIVMDVKVKLYINGSTDYVYATRENFPSDGVDVLIPYPEGTSKDGFEFVINHLVTMGCNGGTVGDMEVFSSYNASDAWKITKGDDGLTIHVMSASPFSIAWQKSENIPKNPEPGEPGTTEPGTTEPGTTEPGTTEPGTTEPGTTEPGTTEPGTTEPGTTEPGTTEPATTAPSSEEPESNAAAISPNTGFNGPAGGNGGVNNGSINNASTEAAKTASWAIYPILAIFVLMMAGGTFFYTKYEKKRKNNK